jgi:hypothetical protein
MATINSDVYALQTNASAQGNGSKLSPGNLGGRVRQLYFSFTGVAVIATTDFIKLCKLPAGARVIDYKIAFPDMGTTGVFKLGNAASSDAVEAADDDAFGSGITVTSAVLHVPAIAHAGLLKKFSSEVDIQLVATTATDAGNVTVNGYFAYVMD